MARGRPLGSERRDVIHRILSTVKTSYSYELWRIIQIAYPEISLTLRVVYYNVDKGIQLNLWIGNNVLVENQNSWEGITGRRMITIKQKCKVDSSEQQMIKDITFLVRKTIERFKELKKDFKLGRIKPFKHYFDQVSDENK